MQIYIDDGSTNIKMLWKDGDQTKMHISPNSFCHGWVPSFGNSAAENYMIDGKQYSFNIAAADVLRTNNVEWQYSPLNALAIQHALQSSGIEPQALELVVTLPLSEYYDANAQVNLHNIERKKTSVMQAVAVNKGTAFTFTKVRVRPESIPAGIDLCETLPETRTVLIVDLGGTTLDIAMVSGKMKNVFSVMGDANLGVSLVVDALVRALVKANTPTSNAYAEDILKHRDDLAFIADRINTPSEAVAIQQAIEEALIVLRERVVAAVLRNKGFSHVLVIGGGAPLVFEAIKTATALADDRCTMVEDPQFALVRGLESIG